MNRQLQWLLIEKYNSQESEAFHADCARLEAGEPLAYVIGWTPFLGCKIWLDSHPLIPRPETEFWVEHAITHITNTLPRVTLGKKVGILDLCAGSGCVGVAVAKALPHTRVDCAEIDTAHHPTINKNSRENLLPITRDRQRVFGGDLFTDIPVSTKYDYILSNPPYIDPALDRTEASVKTYEPPVALYGGVAGLDCIARIIETAPSYLTPRGELWLEHEPEQSQDICRHGARVGFAVTTHHDQYATARYSRLVLQ